MLNPAKSNEAEMWESFLRGDRAAFASLYNSFAEMLYKYGFKITSNQSIIKDCVNEIFIDLWNQKGQLTDVLKPKNYILKAFRYKVLTAIKKEGQMVETDHLPEIPEYSIENQLILNEFQAEKINFLYASMEFLSTRQREVIHLKYFQNLTTKEIAELLDIKPQSVTNILFRGLTSLRKKMLEKIISP